jgi:hypothetical protein
MLTNYLTVRKDQILNKLVLSPLLRKNDNEVARSSKLAAPAGE